MSELRKDPVVGRWVIIASDRARRPSDFEGAAPEPAGGLCPFCPGHEDLTPSEVLALRRVPGAVRDGPGWSLRVVPNKYPALRVEGALEREGEGLFDRMAGVGAHEVIIESSRHSAGYGDLPAEALEDVLWAWGERMRDLARDPRFRAVMVFKNHGPAAGATLAHPHSQLIALPIVPRAILEELEGAQAHFRLKERCIWCDVVRQERRDGTRVVFENERCVVLSPWAAKVPFETWVLPKAHAGHFEDEPRAVLRDVAEALGTVARKLDLALDNPAFNVLLRSAPLRERGLAHYHWHLEVMPAVTRVAGFEWGSGYFINPVPPEEAAAFLRKAGTGG
jgi:UDPglucose--hexose-1-phosphate uridylyltransferase